MKVDEKKEKKKKYKKEINERKYPTVINFKIRIVTG